MVHDRHQCTTPLLHAMQPGPAGCSADLRVEVGSPLPGLAAAAAAAAPAGADWQPSAPYYDAAHPIKGYVSCPGGVQVYWEVHGLPPGWSLEEAQHLPKVVMIHGLACGCSGWRWQLQDLVQHHHLTPNFIGNGSGPAEEQQVWEQMLPPVPPAPPVPPVSPLPPPAPLPQHHHHHQQQQQQRQQQQQGGGQPGAPPCQHQRMLVCILDNRGVGRSGSPEDSASYSTDLMAADVLAVMDHLHWDRAHILGFSMGGMVAQRLAVTAPGRVCSLTLLSTSCGGAQILPHSLSGLRIALRMVMARTPEDAADATLHMHFRRRTLRAWVSHLAAQRHELLRREYLAPDGSSPPQPPHGFRGQLMACWRHHLSRRSAGRIIAAGFPVLVIHGRNDKLASAANAEALARKLQAPCVILPGAHFIVRECAAQINMLLSSLVLGPVHVSAADNSRAFAFGAADSAAGAPLDSGGHRDGGCCKV